MVSFFHFIGTILPEEQTRLGHPWKGCGWLFLWDLKLPLDLTWMSHLRKVPKAGRLISWYSIFGMTIEIIRKR